MAKLGKGSALRGAAWQRQREAKAGAAKAQQCDAKQRLGAARRGKGLARANKYV